MIVYKDNIDYYHRTNVYFILLHCIHEYSFPTVFLLRSDNSKIYNIHITTKILNIIINYYILYNILLYFLKTIIII